MIGVGYINTWTKHILISDAYASAGIDHHITVEVITVANDDPVSRMRLIVGPKPAPLGQRVVGSQLDLRGLANPDLLQPAPQSNAHHHESEERNPQPAHQRIGQPKQASSVHITLLPAGAQRWERAQPSTESGDTLAVFHSAMSRSAPGRSAGIAPAPAWPGCNRKLHMQTIEACRRSASCQEYPPLWRAEIGRAHV